MHIALQRKKVQSDKWQNVKREQYPEELDELKKVQDDLKDKAKELEEKNPGYIYRVIVISSIPYHTEVDE